MTIPGVRRRRPSEETATGWLVVSPWIVGFLIFMVWPLGASMYFVEHSKQANYR